ncbi:MAG TPA: hypothetical protein VIP70_12055 [Nitrososphaeraceae archaeon]
MTWISPAQFQGDDADGCVDVTIGPDAYTIIEEIATGMTSVLTFGDCMVAANNTATGVIESSGQTETCTFRNSAD